MANRLLCFAAAVLISFFISSGEATVTVNMCKSGTTTINDDSLELDAFGPTISPLTTNTSMTCSCSINLTYYSNKVSVQFSRQPQPENVCRKNMYDTATLDIIDYYTPGLSKSLQKDILSNFKLEYDGYIETIEISITITSICGSNYAINLDEVSRWSIKFSQVTCSNSETVVTPSSTTVPPTAQKSTGSSRNTIGLVSAYSSKVSSSATSESVAEKNVLSPSKPDVLSPSKTGLIVGVVVGVGGGLLLLGAIVLAVVIFRRRRAKHQPLTNANQNAPTENSYEPTVEYASVSYENPSSSNNFQTGILYDNRRATTYPLDTESGQNYYNLQGNVNSSFHHSDAVPINDQTTSSSEVDDFVQDPHSINDTDTTVIENDLYEK